MADAWEQPTKIAIDRAKQLFPLGQRFLLEEIDRNQIGNWLVTIGFDYPERDLLPLGPRERMYRQFEIGTSGEVLRMKAPHVA
ncbi:MAG: hypothetical protein JO170_15700 [Verrucomicrobia bacterium]|nr:hypothetical protein [Verrucomicrobiota bacterium]